MATEISMKINCGYARTAIRELTLASRAKHGIIHKPNRSSEIRKLFDRPTHKIPSVFLNSHNTKWSPFDKLCEFVGEMFSKKWTSLSKRVGFTSTFSIEKWRAVPECKKSKHTLSKCDACFNKYKQPQRDFPGKPMYIPTQTPIVTLPNQQNECSNKSQEGRF